MNALSYPVIRYRVFSLTLKVKIDRKIHEVTLEEESDETSFEEIVEELPEDSPRYPLLYFQLLLLVIASSVP